LGNIRINRKRQMEDFLHLPFFELGRIRLAIYMAFARSAI
jgi:hypothetical protein